MILIPNNHSPTPQETKLKESIIEAIKEVKLIQEGKLAKRSWCEMIKEIKEELHLE